MRCSSYIVHKQYVLFTCGVTLLWKTILCNSFHSLKYTPFVYLPTRQGSSIVRRIRTWRWEDDLLWARMKVFRTSFYVPASSERNTDVRFRRDVDATSFLRPRRIRTSGKLSYGPNVGRPLNVRGRLAEWVSLYPDISSSDAKKTSFRKTLMRCKWQSFFWRHIRLAKWNISAHEKWQNGLLILWDV